MIQDNENHVIEETSISLKLADIQRRCSHMIRNPEEFGDLALEDPPLGMDHTNPYDRG